MNPYLVDVPVAIIFFNRPKPLQRVFASVREARPSQLFLIQDGSRSDRDTDVDLMEKCREIVSDIDWECEVHTNFSENNLGCGMRIYSGISWVFEYVDRLIVLEDDCVPSQSFFPFCAELLNRYKDDERMTMISGMNHLDEYDGTAYSYFFAKAGSIWGWATWKRVWDQIDYEMKYMEEKDTLSLLRNSIASPLYANKLLNKCQKKYEQLCKGGQLSSWSTQFGMIMYLHSQLIIVPQKNLISNIGLTKDTTHAVDSLRKIPSGLQRVFFMKAREIEFPLKHPKYIIEDVAFNQKVFRIMGDGYPMISLYRKIESFVRGIIFK